MYDLHTRCPVMAAICASCSSFHRAFFACRFISCSSSTSAFRFLNLRQTRALRRRQPEIRCVCVWGGGVSFLPVCYRELNATQRKSQSARSEGGGTECGVNRARVSVGDFLSRPGLVGDCRGASCGEVRARALRAYVSLVGSNSGFRHRLSLPFKDRICSGSGPACTAETMAWMLPILTISSRRFSSEPTVTRYLSNAACGSVR